MRKTDSDSRGEGEGRERREWVLRIVKTFRCLLHQKIMKSSQSADIKFSIVLG